MTYPARCAIFSLLSGLYSISMTYITVGFPLRQPEDVVRIIALFVVASVGGLGTYMLDPEKAWTTLKPPTPKASLLLLTLLGATLVLPSCMMAPWMSQMDVNDTIKLTKAQGGSGCMYIRVTGAYPPFGNATATIIEAYDTTGTAGADAKTKVTYLDCLKAIGPEQRTLLPPTP